MTAEGDTIREAQLREAKDNWHAAYIAERQRREAAEAVVAAQREALREIDEMTRDCDEISGGWVVGEIARAALTLPDAEEVSEP